MIELVVDLLCMLFTFWYLGWLSSGSSLLPFACMPFMFSSCLCLAKYQRVCQQLGFIPSTRSIKRWNSPKGCNSFGFFIGDEFNLYNMQVYCQWCLYQLWLYSRGIRRTEKIMQNSCRCRPIYQICWPKKTLRQSFTTPIFLSSVAKLSPPAP